MTKRVIVELIASWGDGGLEKHYVDLCNGLARRGHKVIAIHPHDAEIPLASEVEKIPLDMSGWRYNPMTAIRLLGLIRAIKPDVVHAQAGRAATLLSLVKPWLRQPTIATVHNQKKTVRPYLSADQIIAVSKKALGFLPSNANAVAIYNGVETPTPNPSVTLLDLFSTERPTLLSIGRLVEAKGYDLLIQAMVSVDANLAIAGDGPLRGELEAQIKALNVSDKVKLMGSVPNAAGLFHQADACVISSRREGFSYVFAEALACRLPVISTQVNDATSILPECFLIQPTTVKAIAIRLNEWLEMPDVELAMSATWDWSQNNLTTDAMVQQTLSVIENTCTNP